MFRACKNHTDKQVFCKKLCKSCYVNDYNKRRREKLQKEKKAPISQFSDQRKKLTAIYSILRADIMKVKLRCEANLPGCLKFASEIHHKKGRRGFLLIMSKYFGYQCDNCHKICTRDSKMAKEEGLSLPINGPTTYEFSKREMELIEQKGLRLPGNANITLY